MSVYVDRGELLAADTAEELFRAASVLKLPEHSFRDDHYAICVKKRRIAASMGAIELSTREMALKLSEIRDFGVGNRWELVR